MTAGNSQVATSIAPMIRFQFEAHDEMLSRLQDMQGPATLTNSSSRQASPTLRWRTFLRCVGTIRTRQPNDAAAHESQVNV